jgi:ADP-heptose:LPS heptosyltransferase
VEKKCRSYILHLAEDFKTAKNILFVLPEDQLEALFQIENFLSLISLFPDARVILLCDKKISPYFKNFNKISALFEYDKNTLRLFSKEQSLLQKQLLKEYIDLCICLEKNPDNYLYLLIGSSGAKVRLGYFDAGEYPFFNLRIKSTQELIFIKEQNSVMAKLLGAKLKGDIRWSVSKDIIEEMMHRMKEFSIPSDARVGGIDAYYFYYAFGAQWTDHLIESLKSTVNNSWYLITSEVPDHHFLEWLQTKHMPVFTDLSPSRIAALLYKSEIIISGKSVLFAMANLLTRPAIGVFEKQELNRYYKSSPQSKAISFSERPDEHIIEEIGRNISALLRKAGK